MKKALIVTIYDTDNFGNRLQNYAVQQTLNKMDICAVTLKNNEILNERNLYSLRLLKYLVNVKLLNKNNKTTNIIRKSNFKNFDKNIEFEDRVFNFFSREKYKTYDYFVVGSDQVWNPNLGRLRDLDLLNFTDSPQKIALSASFGISRIQKELKPKVEKALNSFKFISVREDDGKKIVEEITNRKDVEVLVDPTMLLTSKEWDIVAKRPEQLDNQKYILNYFLGKMSDEQKSEIERIAMENNCRIINILDNADSFYESGPSEFLYLEKNAFLVCTDSFHSCVFAILYNTPFVVFEREDNTESMSSRIRTLLAKFKLQKRYSTGKIHDELLRCDYTEAYKILDEERKKSKEFLIKALR